MIRSIGVWDLFWWWFWIRRGSWGLFIVLLWKCLVLCQSEGTKAYLLSVALLINRILLMYLMVRGTNEKKYYEKMNTPQT